MKACYHTEITFSDEVFPLLKGRQVMAMWDMLLSGAEEAGLTITFANVSASNDRGSCHWEAQYRFSLTGRRVHNHIHADFEFKDGKIIRHKDRFNFRKWAAMAFGTKGVLLGWMPFFRKKVQQNVALRLSKFTERHPEYQ